MKSQKDMLGGVDAWIADVTAKRDALAAAIGAGPGVENIPATLTVTPKEATKRRGRKPAAKKVVAAPKGKPANKAKASGVKRTQEAIQQMKDEIIKYVGIYPECSSEDIKKGLRLDRSELALPLRQLAQAGALKTVGAKRSTRYSVASKPAPKKHINGVAKRAVVLTQPEASAE